MSKQCKYCGFREPLPFTCRFCGDSFCYNHRLPESHDCPGLVSYKEKVRDSGKIYHYEPDMVIKTRRKTFPGSFINAISIMKSNYTVTLITLAAISFLLQFLIRSYSFYFVLIPGEIFSRPWTLLSHMFLHAGPVHLLFNMLFLFFIGTELERRIGGKKFLTVFFISGLIAGIGYSLWSIIVLGNPYAAAVGASGALFGIFACLAVLAPHIRLYIYFIPMQITQALVLFALFDLLLIGQGDMIARSAHLSGLVAGLFLGKQIKEKGQFIRY